MQDRQAMEKPAPGTDVTELAWAIVGTLAAAWVINSLMLRVACFVWNRSVGTHTNRSVFQPGAIAAMKTVAAMAIASFVVVALLYVLGLLLAVMTGLTPETLRPWFAIAALPLLPLASVFVLCADLATSFGRALAIYCLQSLFCIAIIIPLMIWFN